jgi:hypothetical protein
LSRSPSRRKRPANQPLSRVLVDIDDCKAINDSYGHGGRRGKEFVTIMPDGLEAAWQAAAEPFQAPAR